MADLQAIGQKASDYVAMKHLARERALPKSRAAIRLCANAIRAAHRDDFELVNRHLTEAGGMLRDMTQDLREHLDIF